MGKFILMFLCCFFAFSLVAEEDLGIDNIGKYKLIIQQGKEGHTLYLLDTETGTVWWYNHENFWHQLPNPTFAQVERASP